MLTKEEIIKAIKQCEAAAAEVRTRKYKCVEIKCFNREEAEWYKQYWEKTYPDIPIYVSWLEFDGTHHVALFQTVQQ